MGYIIKAKDSMENKTREDICKIPRVLNSVCNALNMKNHLDRLKDD